MSIPRKSLFAKKASSRNRSRGGAAANRAGDAFESVIMASVRDREGQVVKLKDLPKCGARFHGPGTAHPLPICCDFVGTVVGPGTGIFFDAKSTEDAYGFPLNDEKSLKGHQAEHLFEQREAGAIAGILVEARHLGQYLWLDGKHLGRGRAYIAWHDPRWVKLGATGGLVQFRELVRAYAQGSVT